MRLSPLPTREGLNLKIIVRYALLQIPGLILTVIGLYIFQIWFDLADWLFWLIISIVVIKDIILFPFLWPAYDWNNPGNRDPLLGQHGVARERLAPKGYIFLNGELWMAEVAEGEPPIEKDKAVTVTRVEGLVLTVRPIARNEE